MKAIEHRASVEIEKLQLSPACWISYQPNWLATQRADCLFDELLSQLDWQSGQIRMFGKWLDIPRLHAWYGDAGASYGWSGQRAQPQLWHKELQTLRDQLQEHASGIFNGVLANLYRTGQDCMHWHADDEGDLGTQPLIAAISLGAERRFVLRHKKREQPTHRLQLGHGSLLLMGGDTQEQWQHALPRSKRIEQARISLTYRRIY